MNMDFSQAHILVLGDVMLDEYLAAGVNRISPEAPVPVAVIRDRWHVPGGAANVARNLAQLGCRVTLTGLCGRDAAGETLASLLSGEGIDSRLHAAAGVPTIQKTRVVAQGQQMLRLDQERPSPLTVDQYAALRAMLHELVPHCHAVILSDYAKGTLGRLPDGACLAQEAVLLCAEKNIPVCVDPKGNDWGRYAGASCVTPNASEFTAMVGRVPSGRATMEADAATLCDEYQFERLLVTRGGKGMALFEKDTPPLYIKAKAKEVIDVSGAGDTVIAVLVACRALGLAWAEAAEWANRAAGVVVSKAGTSPVTREEFDALLTPGRSSPKIVSLERLADMVASWRRAGDSIVFTNGCFDLLHKGHVRLVNEAAAQGDRLIVGLNTDSSVRRLKGPDRPVQDERSRALLVAALEHVDAVVLFDDDTPLALIRAIVPDVLVKGGDYTPQTVVGADVVTNAGGRVYLVELEEGVSTTLLVARVGQNSHNENRLVL
jgi:D-beta-D-heptose 7-phosphate kinase/D-beta-D-heptose 1-phosphate adenosyltransferase